MPSKKIDFEVVRQIALKFPGVEESSLHGFPSLKVSGRLLACPAIHKSAEPNSLAVRIDLDQRAKLLRDEPDVYYLTAHYVNYPTVLVRMGQIGRKSLRELLHAAWRFASSKAKRAVAKSTGTHDEYLAGQSPQNRAALEKVRRAVRAAVPNAEECISYGMPAFRLNGKLIAGFQGAANHCSFHPMSGTTVATLKADLAGYETSKGTIRFSPAAGLPAALVRKLVKARMAELG